MNMAEKKYILYLLDADKWASPFDINVAYDAGFDVVIPYGSVTAETIRTLVEDAMFSRGLDGAQRTKIFLNGSDLNVVRDMLKTARKSMVTPFDLSIFVDPRGGYTTGSAMVAQVEAYLNKIGKTSFEGLKVVVFGGTGPVGQVVSVLCAQNGAEVVLLSRRQEKAERIAGELKELYKVDLIPKANGDDPQRVETCKDADIIFTCGTAGIQLVSLNVLKQLPKNKILADVNAVPPLGIEGINVNKKNKEHPEVPGLYYHGALSVGSVKLKVEKKGLKALMTAEGKKTFDFVDFFDTARKVYAKKKAKKAEKQKA
ncbi:MAG: methylenetetrahydromethanopterin dehydrogenase [Candidatus Lokiarchaeota archaeon]|nr:methylenetetrahydromethanopterin dehydrogenase [Candidatus Lokiarchaeota archaeon]